MTGHDAYPPPGGHPPAGPPATLPPTHQSVGGAPAPGWAPPPPGYGPAAGGPAPGYAAHKPGAVPLRPLGLGDIYDAAFKIIRINPKATVGSAVLVASVAMALPVLVTSALAVAVDLTPASGEQGGWEGGIALLGSMSSFVVGAVLQAVGLVLVTGMVTHVTMAATLGRRLDLGGAWAATRGKRWALIGLALLQGFLLLLLLGLYVALWALVVSTGDVLVMVVWGVVTVPLMIAFLFWFWVRVYYLPVPALMLEDVGILGALSRGLALTKGQFWRILGIALLTLVLTQVAASMLTMPLAVLGQVPLFMGASEETAFVVLMLVQALSTVVAAAFTAPFGATVAALLYVDQRIRKEGFDVDLVTGAGTTPR